MKILITGAAGFIGSAVCNKFIKDGHEVLAIDNFSDYYDVGLKLERVNALLAPMGTDIIDLDISDLSEINKFIKLTKPEIVINLAAQPGVRLKMTDNYKYIRDNVEGFNNVLVSSLDNRVPFFLYASSSSVYGDLANIPYQEAEVNLRPNSFYGVTKLSNELSVDCLVRNSITRARGLRFFTVYGSWGRPDMIYFRIISNLLTNSKLDIFGDGEVQRDFTYISDAVSCVSLLVAEMQNRPKGFIDVVNIGGGRPYSINHLIKVVESLAGKKVNSGRFEINLNDVKSTEANFAYLQSLINFKPQTSIEDGIHKVYDWAQQESIRNKIAFWVNSVS